MTLLSTSENERLRTIVERIFERMLLLFGKRFADSWKMVDPEKMKNEWCTQLQEYSLNELKHGVESLKELDWPPTLPEFKKLCRKPLNALEAYYEAVQGLEMRTVGKNVDWSHPAVFWAANSLAHDLLHQSYSAIRVRWERAIEQQMQKKQWEPIPAPRMRLMQEKNPIRKENMKQFVTEALNVLSKKKDHDHAKGSID